MADKIEKYGLLWDKNTHPLEIERWCVRKGPEWMKAHGTSLFHHYRQIQSILWPKDDHHRWSDLILRTFCEGEITVLVGCSDSGKTFGMSKLILVDYWCFPAQTLWLVSTTEGRGSELRIWGCIKDLFNQARRVYEFLEGNPIDYLKTITTDEVDEERREARSLRRGIIVVPCKTGGVVSGLAPYIGIKAPRLRHAGDEVAAMSDSFLNAYSNWYGKEDFKGIMSGNFMEYDDPLGVASEPVGGWDDFVDTGKTQTWKSKFYGATVVALDGRDSPNFDFPLSPSGRTKYPYMISQKKLDGTAATHGTDSWQWYSQCVGKPAKGMDIWRVLTKDFCKKHFASDEVTWDAEFPITQLYSLDPAYGGGDRCVGRLLKMGRNLDGVQTLWFGPPEIIPIKVNINKDAEEQIALYVHRRLKDLGVESKNCFYDSFGRGTLGFEFAKVFGASCPVPVDSSATPTTRPVRFDLFVEDKSTGKQRLKRCDEHYKKFITEMYFSLYEAINSEQVRGLDSESIREGCARKFSKNGDGKIELEPKDDYKERNKGMSPDMMDNAVIGCEGARRLGFKIEKLADDVKKANPSQDSWLYKHLDRLQKLEAQRELQTA